MRKFFKEFDYISFMLFVAVMLFFSNKAMPFRIGKSLFLLWSMMFLISSTWIENKWIKWFIIWSVIRTYLTYSGYGFTTLQFIFVGCLAYQAMVTYFKKTNNYNKILNTMCVLGIIQTTMLILQYNSIWLFLVPIGIEFRTIIPGIIATSNAATGMNGFFSSNNMSGAFLALCLPAFFRGGWWFLTPLVGVGLWLAVALGGIMPAVFGTLLFFIIKSYRINSVGKNMLILWAYIVFVIIVIISGVDQGGSQARLKAWGAIWDLMIKEKFIFGWGVGLFKESFPALSTDHSQWMRAHNEYLQVWVEHGLIGLLIVSGFIIEILKNGFRLCKDRIMLIALCGFIIGLLNMGVNFLMHTTGGVFLLVWGAMIEGKAKGGEIR